MPLPAYNAKAAALRRVRGVVTTLPSIRQISRLRDLGVSLARRTQASVYVRALPLSRS